jgi:hypothetical protein
MTPFSAIINLMIRDIVMLLRDFDLFGACF